MSSATSSWHGTLNLTYAKCGDRTRVVDAYSQAPLKLQRSFHPDGRTCQSVVLHTAGGVVGGDRLSHDVDLQPDAEVTLTTVSASKIYRSNGRPAQQTLVQRLGDRAYLEYLPREAIVFNGAQFRQDLRVELGRDAVWLGWELVRFGRTARNERFDSGIWRSHTEVWRDDKPLWIDRQQLVGGSPLLDAPNGLNGQPVVGTLAWVGQPVSEAIARQVRERWNDRAIAGDLGLSRLESGVICRYRGRSTQAAIAAFLELWQALRQSYRDRPAEIPRVWQV